MNSRVRDQLLCGSVWQDRDCVEDYDDLVHAIGEGDAREVAEGIGAEKLAALPHASQLCEALSSVDTGWLFKDARGRAAHNHPALFEALAPYPPIDLEQPFIWRSMPPSEQDELRQAIRANG